MAIPTFASIGVVRSGIGAIGPVAMGADHVADDIDIMYVESANSNINPATLSTAAGFAHLLATTGQGTADATSATRLDVFWRRWNGTDGSPTITDLGNHGIARIVHIRGCITTGNPWDVTQISQQTSATTAGSVTGTTTTVDDCLILLLTAADLPDANGTTEFSGWTNAGLSSVTLHGSNTQNKGNGGGISSASGGLATAGAIGTSTFTSATTSLKDHAVVALKPPVAGEATTIIPKIMHHRKLSRAS